MGQEATRKNRTSTAHAFRSLGVAVEFGRDVGRLRIHQDSSASLAGSLFRTSFIRVREVGD